MFPDSCTLRSALPLVAASSIALSLPSVSFAEPLHKDKLVIHYPFDEGSGTVAVDASGNGYDGVIVGGPAWVAGQVGQAIDLDTGAALLSPDASGQHIDMPDVVLGPELTVMCWTFRDSQTQWSRLFEFSNGANVSVIYAAQENTTDNLFYRITDLNTNAGANFDIRATNAFADNAWAHYAVTVSDRGHGSSVMEVFKDGVLVGSRADASRVPVGVRTVNYIGRSTGNDQYLDMKLDEFRVYSIPLSPAEIAKIVSLDETPFDLPPSVTLDGGATINHRAGTTFTDPGVTVSDPEGETLTPVVTYAKDVFADGLVARWTFDGDLADSTANGLVGVHVNTDATNLDTDGIVGKSVTLDGVNETIQVAHDPLLKPDDALTITAWVKPTDFNTGANHEVYRKEDGNDRHLLSFQSNGTILAFGVGTDSGYVEMDLTIDPNDFLDGNWHMVTAVYADGLMETYVDGVSGINQPTVGTPTIAGTAPAYIGSYNGTGEFFKGSIDDVRVYSVGLDADQVTALWNEGKSDAFADSLDATVPGNWSLTYTATDSAANVSTAVRKLFVYAADLPELVLNGDNPVTRDPGAAFTDPGATAKDDQGSVLDANVAGVQVGMGVHRWVDGSGLGNHLAQTAADAVPVLVPKGFNGMPTLVFDGQDVLENPGITGANSFGDFTYIAVHEFDNPQAPNWNTIVGLQDVNSANGLALLQRMNDNDQIGMHHAGRNGNNRVKVDVLYGPRVSILSRSGGTDKAYGAEVTVSSNGLVSTGTQNWDCEVFTSRLQVGGRQQTTTTYFSGKISEIIVLGSGLAIADIEKTEGHLAHKWGLADDLPLGHTYKDAPPDLWTPADLPAMAGWYDANSITPDTNAAEYTLEYTYTDGSGKSAIPVTRTVVSVDNTPPSITLVGEDTIQVRTGNPYVEPGVTATDNLDGALVATSSGITWNQVQIQGYMASGRDDHWLDLDFNGGLLEFEPVAPPQPFSSGPEFIGFHFENDQLFRSVVPAITRDDDFQILIHGVFRAKVSGVYLFLTDWPDDRCSFWLDLDQDGRFEKDGNAGNEWMNTGTRYGFTYLHLKAGEIYDFAMAYAEHAGGSRVTAYIEIPGRTRQTMNPGDPEQAGFWGFRSGVDIDTPGTYTLTYSATDRAGNSNTATRTVIVGDFPTAPTIALNGGEHLRHRVGESFIDPGVTITDGSGQVINGANPDIGGDFNPDKPGFYQITYDYEDSTDGPADTVIRYVEVFDNLPPAISLLGGDTIDVNVGTVYQEPGVAITDNSGEALEYASTADIPRNGLMLHVDATFLQKIYSPGDVIAEWPDLSGNNRHFDNIRGVPTFSLSGINGNPSVHLAQDDFIATGYQHGSRLYSVAVVGQWDGGAQGRLVSSYDNINWLLGWDGNAENVAHLEGWASDTANRPPITQNPHLYIATNTGGAQSKFYGDGVDLTFDSWPNGRPGRLQFGGYQANQTPASGYISEAILYNRVITEVERLGIELYLNTKYGLNATAQAAPLDTSKIGTYNITYITRDSSGNTATATRTVNVVPDTSLPTITLNGDSLMTHEFGEPFTDPLAVANAPDGTELAIDLAGTGTVDVNKIGAYSLTYNFTDTSGNVAPTVVRQVVVEDNAGPVISLTGEQVVRVQIGQDYQDQGGTATDARDGDRPISFTSSKPKPGYIPGLHAGGFPGNADLTTPNNNYFGDDPDGPTYSESKSSPPWADNFTIIYTGEIYDEDGVISFTENIDDKAYLWVNGQQLLSDVGWNNRTEKSVDFGQGGWFQFELRMSNGGGGAGVAAAPGFGYDPDGGTDYVLPRNTPGEMDLFRIEGVAHDGVDTSELGTFTVTLSAEDNLGNKSSMVRTVIVVADNTIPYIALNGEALVQHEAGTPYTDAGAIAYAGDGTLADAGMVGTGTVDPDTPGTYKVTFNYTDGNSVAAQPAVRTVVVKDTLPPVITLTDFNGQGQFVRLFQNQPYTDPGATSLDINEGVVRVYSELEEVPNALAHQAYLNNPDETKLYFDQDTSLFNLVPNGYSLAHRKFEFLNDLDFMAAYPQAVTQMDNYHNLWHGTFNAIKTGEYEFQLANVADRGTLWIDLDNDGTWSRTGAKGDEQICWGNSSVRTTISKGTYRFAMGHVEWTGSSSIQASFRTPEDAGPFDMVLIDPGSPEQTGIWKRPASEPVDTSILGRRKIRYWAIDAARNISIVERTVIIEIDRLKPVLARLGDPIIKLEAGKPYTDPGALLYDYQGNELDPAGIVATNVPSGLKSGTYVIDYNYTDAGGHVADTVTRTVRLEDTVPPVIKLNGIDPVTIRTGSNYVDAGATATDIVDGNLLVSSNLTLPLNGLHAWYTFDQTSGDIAKDETGNYDGTLANFNGGGWTTDAKFGGALHFNPNNENAQYVQLPSFEIAGPFSVAVWVKFDATENWSRIIDFGNGTTENILLANVAATDQVHWGIRHGGTESNIRVNTFWEVGNWMHVVGTVDKNDLMSLYKDGQLVGTNTAGRQPLAFSRTNQYIGRSNWGNDRYYRGIMDEVMLYRRALPISDIQQLVTGPQPIDTSAEGSQTITYNVLDQAGNMATATRTVVIVDVPQVPSITLVGDAEVVVDANPDPYDDPGVNVYDAAGTEITNPTLTVTGQVNTAKLGLYTLVYDFTDGNGNAAASAVRKVTVVDQTSPVLTLVGGDTIQHQLGNDWVDPGVTAIDFVEGEVAFVSSEFTNNAILHQTYELDSVPQEVINFDQNGGLFQMQSVGSTLLANGPRNEGLRITNDAEFQTANPYLTRTDNFQNLFTGHFNAKTAGVYEFGLAGRDDRGTFWLDLDRDGVFEIDGDNGNEWINGNYDAGRYGQVELEQGYYKFAVGHVEYGGGSNIDARWMTISGSGPRARSFVKPSDPLQDGFWIQYNPVDYQRRGTYTITYTASDSQGNTSTATRTVIVDSNPDAPVITLNGQNQVVQPYGQAYTDPGAVVKDKDGQVLEANITASSGQVDHTQPGEYVLAYTYTDQSGLAAKTLRRTVTVADTTPPVITLLGDAEMNHFIGTPFKDPGATALDDFDGELRVASSELFTTDGLVLHLDPTNIPGAKDGDPVMQWLDLSPAGNHVTNTQGSPTYVADAINGRPGVFFGTSTSMAAPNDVGSAYTIFTVSHLSASDTNGRLLASENQNWLLGYWNNNENVYHPGNWVSLTNGQTATTNPHLYIATSSGRTYKRFWNESGERTEFPAVTNGAMGKFQMGAYWSDLRETADGVVSEVLIFDRFLKSYERLSLQSRLAVKYGFQQINGTLPVDPNKFGQYTILYSVEDSNGNVSTIERIVNVVPDPDAPVITLAGDEVHHHEQGTAFADPGFTLTDSGGTDLVVGNVVVTGTVDADTAGTYKLTYNFTDGNGKSAPTKTRFVIVADTAPPVITLQGDPVIKLKQGNAYAEPGFSAEDLVEGSKQAVSNLEWIPNVLNVFGYMEAGRADTMMHLENDGQLLSLVPVGSSTFSGDIVALNGDGAFQAIIPEITQVDDYQVVWQGYFKASVDGDYEFGIDNADDRCSFWIDLDQDKVFEDNPPGDAGSEVVFTNYTGGGYKTYTLTAGYYRVAIAFAEFGGGAWVRPRVNTPGTTGRIPVYPGDPDNQYLWFVPQAPDFVDVNTPGTYTIDYAASDSKGNRATVQRTIVVVADDTLPFISLKRGLNITHEAGAAFTDPGAIVKDENDNELESNLIGASTVVADTPGTYTITYEYTHPTSQKVAVPAILTVKVVDTTKPTITLNPDGGGAIDPIEFVVGDTVVDPGVTATDNSSVAAHTWSSLEIPTNGLISIYRFDETSGTRVQDDWGGHHAQLVNMDDNAHVDGRIGKGLYFNGIKADDQYVKIPSYDFGGEFSVAMWVLFENFNNWSRVFSFNNGANNNNVLIANPGTTDNLALSIRQGTTERRLDVTAFWQSPDWIHMTATVSADGAFKVYKNGDLAGEMAGGHVPLQLTRTNHWLGKSAWTTDEMFQGTLDHLLFYKRVLTPAEAKALGTATPIALDTTKDATHTVQYFAVDNGANRSTTQRTFIIKPDPSAPVLTLNGTNPYIHESGTPFTDPGATAKDDQGTDLDANVPGVSSAFVVRHWADQSGKANHLDQADPASSPSLDPTGFNGKPTLVFSGTDVLANPSVDGIHSYGDFTYIAVHEFGNPQAPYWNTIVGIQDVDTANGLVLLQRMNNNDEIGMHHAGRNGNARVRVYSLYGPKVTILSRSGGTGKGMDADVIVSSNGVVATGTQTWEAEIPTSRLQVAGRQQTTTTNYAGKISEIIVLGAGLAIEDIEKAEGYLAYKWGMEADLAVGHTYKDAPPDQWTPVDLPAVAGWYDAATITPDNTSGSFTLKYTFTDGNGKSAIPVTRQVVVKDTAPPSLTLSGDNPVTVQLGSDYVDAGVAVEDVLEGTIAPVVTNTNPFKGYVPGLLAGGLVGNYSMAANPGDLGVDPLGPTLTETALKPPWKDNWTFVYTGEIYDEDGILSFREDINDKARLSVGPDFAVLNDAAATTPTEKAINVGQGGWFPFELRVSNNNGTAGMNSAPGFGFDPAGGTDYVLPRNKNENTASLFRYYKTFHDKVKTDVEGAYTLTYTATDSSGNTSSITRTIIVQDDPTLPVLTLLGETDVTWEAGEPWVEPGYEIHDRRGNPIQGTATITGTVDHSALGLYTLYYDFELSPGKTAPRLTRKVQVFDTTPPVITLTGGTPFGVLVDGNFTDPGAVVTDNLDTGLTTEGKLKLDLSTLVVHWSFDDAAGLVAEDKINDLDGTLVNFIDPDPTAYWVDGKYGKALKFDGDSQYVTIAPTGLLDLQEFTISFWIHSDDYSADMLVFEKTADNTVNSQYNVFFEQGDLYYRVTDLGATYYEATLDVSGAFTNSQWHHIAVTYDGTDQSIYVDGEFLASEQPQAVLNTSPAGPSYIGALAPGSGYNLNGTLDDLRIYNEAVPIDKVASLMSILGIDTTKVSTEPYILEYTATDSSGNTTTIQRAVVVTGDNVAPVLTLVGLAEITIEQGTPYTDQGATATDNEDASQVINALIQVTGLAQVDVNTPGEYIVTYSVRDTSGNDATPITRKVIVTVPSDKFVQWVATTPLKDLPSGDQALDADPDADSIINLVEYALGTQPTVPTPRNPFTVPDTTPGKLTVTYIRLKPSEDTTLTIKAQLTTNLKDPASWSDTAVTESLDADQSGLPSAQYERIKVEANTPIASETSGHQFIRVYIEKQ